MSHHLDYDPNEYAEALAEGADLGHGDLPGRRESGLTRGELLKRGAVGAAALSGAGALAGSAAAQTSASGKFTGTLRVLTLGVEFPTPDIAKQASKDLGFTVKPILAPSEKQPQIAITSPDTFDVFGGYNYQSLLVWPSGSLQPVDTRTAPELEESSTSSSREASSTRRRRSARSATATRRSGRRTSIRTVRPGCPRSTAGRRTTSRSSAGSARTASRSAASRSRGTSSARPRISTPTRWATTPT